nr:hypothetical protein [Tanacetum cinerariifolium]
MGFRLGGGDGMRCGRMDSDVKRIAAVDSDGHLRSCPGLGVVDGGRRTRSYDRLAGPRRIRVGSWNVESLTCKLLELCDTLGRHKVDIACFQKTKWKGSRAREGNSYKLWYSGSSNVRNGVESMVRDVTNDEINKALFSLGDNKASGPDGFSAAFFKETWDIISDDVCKAIKEFFTNGILLIELNHTIIALIPKVAAPLRVNDFCLISCCNVLFKCISKIISNRIKGSLADLVSPNQSAFVPGRRISDNIFLTQELMHNYHVDRGSASINGYLHGYFKVIIEGETANVISAYAPQVGLSDAKKEVLGRLGRACEGGFTEVLGFGDRNEEGCTILEFATAHELVVANSFFKESDACLITFQSGGHNTQIDYLLVRRGDLRASKDCRAYPGEACSSQHRLVIVDVLFEIRRHSKEATRRPGILWKNLKWKAVETFRATVMERLAALEEVMSASGADQMWNTLDRVMKDATNESLGVANETTRTHSTHMESWWFCEEVQTKVTLKQSRFKELFSCFEGNQEDIDLVKERGANDIYKIAKAQERRRRDIGNERYIKDEGGRTIVREKDIRKRCGKYFSSFFNENPFDESRADTGRNKSVGPDQIPIEAWRSLEEEEGDAQACSNYRGIKLLSHTMKLWERVIERRLRKETKVSENQFGFMPGRSTTEAIHLLRSLMEKYREKQRDLHIDFLDLEKAYDSVPRELVWKTLIDKGTPRRYSSVIKDMYEGVKTRVRTTMGNTDFFPVEVGFHQGLAISPYLFTLILDELSRGIQEDIPWCMIFADDIVLIAELAKGLNDRLESWRKALEDNGLRILQPKESFRYLGSVIHRSGRIDDGVAHRIRAGWMKVLADHESPSDQGGSSGIENVEVDLCNAPGYHFAATYFRSVTT